VYNPIPPREYSLSASAVDAVEQQVVLGLYVSLQVVARISSSLDAWVIVSAIVMTVFLGK
jgi:hypothetical protein